MLEILRKFFALFTKAKATKKETFKLPTNPAIDLSRHELTGEIFDGEAYCVKCKEKRECRGPITVSQNGGRLGWGICPVCGITMNRILSKN